jgi:hypothetical protein
MRRPPGRGKGRALPPKEARGPNQMSLNQHQQQRPATTPVISSLVMYRPRVKREPLNGEAVKVMASMLLDDLLHFAPMTPSEAAVAGRALRHAEAVYQDAKRLASEVAWLNALIADARSGEGAPA